MASDIGILGGFPKDRLIDKVAKQAKMKARIMEEKRLNGIVRRIRDFRKCKIVFRYMHNIEISFFFLHTDVFQLFLILEL
jgi:hypothetical protein